MSTNQGRHIAALRNRAAHSNTFNYPSRGLARRQAISEEIDMADFTEDYLNADGPSLDELDGPSDEELLEIEEEDGFFPDADDLVYLRGAEALVYGDDYE